MRRPESKDELDLRTSTNLLAFACYSYATCFTPFLRWGFGTEALGFHGIAALFVLLCTAAFGPEPLLVNYGGCWLGALAIQRVKSLWDWSHGHPAHSRYAGYPLLAPLCFGQIQVAKWIIEPALCYAVGVLASRISPVLHSFFVGGAISLLIVQVLEWRVDQVRLQHMRDAEIEQRYMAELYRNH